MKFYKNIFTLLFSLTLLLLISGCYKMPKKASLINEDQEKIIQKRKLDFIVSNKTKNTIYATCFYYAKAPDATRWDWEKSPVYQLIPNDEKTINIELIPREDDYKNVYGTLGIYKNFENADDAILETSTEDEKNDLGPLFKLKKEKISIYDETYGTNRFYYYKLEPITKTQPSSLNFLLTNETGTNLYIALFTYEKESGQPMFRWDKNDIFYIENGKSTKIEVDSITNPGAFEAGYSYLGVFKETEKNFADLAGYPNLNASNKIHLGFIKKFINKNVIIYRKDYGLLRYAYDILPEDANIPSRFAFKIGPNKLK